MQLSAELFRRIVDTLHSDERTCSRHEKRREGRAGLRCSVELIPRIFGDNGRKPIAATVRDISPSGMGFILHQRVAVGVELVCRLPVDDKTAIEVIMAICHCGRLSKDLFCGGCKLRQQGGQKIISRHW